MHLFCTLIGNTLIIPVDKKSKMPINPGILAKVQPVLAESAQEPDSIMLWAACMLLGFHTFGGNHSPMHLTLWPISPLDSQRCRDRL